MHPDHSPYLNALKRSLGETVIPSMGEGMEKQIAMCSYRILGRLVAEEKHLEKVNSQAILSFQKMREELLSVLEAPEEISALELLETALDAEFSSRKEAYCRIEIALQKLVSLLIASTEPYALVTIRNIAKINSARQQTFQSFYDDEITLSESSTESMQILTNAEIVKLNAFLIRRFPTESELEIVNIKAVPGGFSKQTLFVTLGSNRELPDCVVVRLDKSDSPVGSTVKDEYDVIARLHEVGVAVPKPYAIEHSGEVLGGPFIVVSRVEGSNAGDAMDVQQGSRALALDLAKMVAKMHTIDPVVFGDEIPGAGVTITERLLSELKEFEGRWRSAERPSIALETAFAWLRKNINLADGKRSLIHKDIGCHNFLAKDEKVTALLDWETASIGSPAQDLGYMYPTVVQMCAWEDFMSAYRKNGGPEVTQEQVDYYRIWAYTWLVVMVGAGGLDFEEGVTEDIQLGYAGAYLLCRLESRLTASLDQAL
jgi:aminoglycoside phosphotransferase (APT) family kinase protein